MNGVHSSLLLPVQVMGQRLLVLLARRHDLFVRPNIVNVHSRMIAAADRSCVALADVKIVLDGYVVIDLPLLRTVRVVLLSHLEAEDACFLGMATILRLTW